MQEIMLWNMKDDIGKFDEVDKCMMQFCIDAKANEESNIYQAKNK